MDAFAIKQALERLRDAASGARAADALRGEWSTFEAPVLERLRRAEQALDPAEVALIAELLLDEEDGLYSVLEASVRSQGALHRGSRGSAGATSNTIAGLESEL